MPACAPPNPPAKGGEQAPGVPGIDCQRSISCELRRQAIMKRNLRPSLAAIAVAGILPLRSAPASELLATHRIPAALALEAVGEAVAVCAKGGYAETAVLVDADGVKQAVLRGDGTGPHSLDSASGKAYTSVTLKSN